MSSIKIGELPIGYFELFSDSESYIEELSEVELKLKGGYGGASWFLLITALYA